MKWEKGTPFCTNLIVIATLQYLCTYSIWNLPTNVTTYLCALNPPHHSDENERLLKVLLYSLLQLLDQETLITPYVAPMVLIYWQFYYMDYIYNTQHKAEFF